MAEHRHLHCARAFFRMFFLPYLSESDKFADESPRRLECISFEGCNLSRAYRVWHDLLDDDVLIFLGVAGVLTDELRGLIVHLLSRRLVDCVVSTGANLHIDIHDTLGSQNRFSDTNVDHPLLAATNDTGSYGRTTDSIENDKWVSAFAQTLEARAYGTREFFNALGRQLWNPYRRDGILTAAYTARVPIYCPAIADSPLGMALASARSICPAASHIDVIQDIIECTNLVLRKPKTAAIIIGDGTTKHFINRASLMAGFFDERVTGHCYVLQITSDVPDSGCVSEGTLRGAHSWGKLAREAACASLRVDATVGVSLLVAAVDARQAHGARGHRPPDFDVSGRAVVVDGVELPFTSFISCG